MRYNRLVVFAGAWGALVLMTFLSCALGHVVTQQTWLSTSVTHYIAASLFLIFALHMLYEGYQNKDNSATEEMEEVAMELREDDEELRVRFRKNSTTDLKDVDNPQMVVEIVRNSSSPSENEPIAQSHVSEINTTRSRSSPGNRFSTFAKFSKKGVTTFCFCENR